MALQLQSIREQRRDQMYPAFDPTEIERVRKFGKVRSFAGGERLWTAGQVAPGLMVVLAGSIAVTQHDQFDNEEPIGILRPGNFLGELAQLSGRPALVDAIAQEPVQALIIPPRSARAPKSWQRRTPTWLATNQIWNQSCSPGQKPFRLRLSNSAPLVRPSMRSN
jgi:thioredoxin reductase (NADPH)